jgi:hypothetical protein
MSKSLFDKRRIYEALKNKLKIDFRDSRELVGWYYLDGKKTNRFTIPKGRGTITPGYQKAIEKKSRLNNEDFERLIICPMGGPEYDDKMRELVRNRLL